MSEVDPASEEARRRRESLGTVGPSEHASREAVRPYAVAALLMGAMLLVLVVVRPEWVRSYAWLVAALVALPFLHTVFFGVLSDGWLIPRPFGLRPLATVVSASGLFVSAAIVAPEAVARLGPSAMGFLVGIILAALVIRWIVALLD